MRPTNGGSDKMADNDDWVNDKYLYLSVVDNTVHTPSCARSFRAADPCDCNMQELMALPGYAGVIMRCAAGFELEGLKLPEAKDKDKVEYLIGWGLILRATFTIAFWVTVVLAFLASLDLLI